MLENCRGNRGEKANDDALSRRMAGFCDVYVNDAFATAHRAEATVHGMARYAPVACAGPLLAAELDALAKVMEHPKRPLVAIVGGSKVSTKLGVLDALASIADHLIVGGALANTFLSAQGSPIGKSLAEPELIAEAGRVVAKIRARGGDIPLPIDVVCAKRLESNAPATAKSLNSVEPDDIILDVGPQSALRISELIRSAGTVLWNGPLGVFEFDQFASGTKMIAEAIAASKAFSVAGGGETLAAIARFGVRDKIDYISTGGGAFLEFLRGDTLPAVAVLEQRSTT